MPETSEKLAKIRKFLAAKKLDGVVFNTRANVAWLSGGADAHVVAQSERAFGTLVVTAKSALLVANRIESDRLAHEEPLGVIYRKTDYSQPAYDGVSGPAVYPVYHVISGLTRGSGQKLVGVESSDPAKVQCLAYRAKGGTTLWIANLTADPQTVSIVGAKGAVFGTMLDEDSFVKATTDPQRFQSGYKPLNSAKLKLKAYAVAILSVND